MPRQRWFVMMVGLASLGCFVYVFAFIAWALKFFPRVWQAAMDADLETLERLQPSTALFLLHTMATIMTLGVMALYVADAWNRQSLSKVQQSSWTAGFVTLGPLLYPAYFWLHYRNEPALRNHAGN